MFIKWCIEHDCNVFVLSHRTVYCKVCSSSGGCSHHCHRHHRCGGFALRFGITVNGLLNKQIMARCVVLCCVVTVPCANRAMGVQYIYSVRQSLFKRDFPIQAFTEKVHRTTDEKKTRMQQNDYSLRKFYNRSSTLEYFRWDLLVHSSHTATTWTTTATTIHS